MIIELIFFNNIITITDKVYERYNLSNEMYDFVCHCVVRSEMFAELCLNVAIIFVAIFCGIHIKI